jgi:DNA-binding protein YbaB
MTGTGHVQSVEITPSLTGHELEQSIQDATNAAGAAAKQLYAEAIRELANELDLNLPGIDSMLTTLTGGR